MWERGGRQRGYGRGGGREKGKGKGSRVSPTSNPTLTTPNGATPETFFWLFDTLYTRFVRFDGPICHFDGHFNLSPAISSHIFLYLFWPKHYVDQSILWTHLLTFLLNALPVSLHDITDIGRFKKSLKTVLFERAFPDAKLFYCFVVTVVLFFYCSVFMFYCL